MVNNTVLCCVLFVSVPTSDSAVCVVVKAPHTLHCSRYKYCQFLISVEIPMFWLPIQCLPVENRDNINRPIASPNE